MNTVVSTTSPMSLAFPSNRHVSAKLRVFIDWVVALITEHTPVPERRCEFQRTLLSVWIIRGQVRPQG